MKNHPYRKWEKFAGMNSTDPMDRLADDKLSLLLNGYCDPTGQIRRYPGVYPVTMADALGLASGDAISKVHRIDRFRGKTGIQRGVAVVGDTMLRSGPNNVYDTWLPVVFPASISAPALDRVASFVFKNSYCYHQNGEDIPFRVKMEEEDGSAATTDAEILGLTPPMYFNSDATTSSAGARFPTGRPHAYAITYVYGNRGESGPSPVQPYEPSSDLDSITFSDLPAGPAGCTSKKIYRTKIGASQNLLAVAASLDKPTTAELFFLQEIAASTTSWTDDYDDSTLDYSQRLPPARPFPPRAKYQLVHQDRIAWANLREHPWVLGFVSDPGIGTISSSAITISNTGNGTISIVTNLGTTTISNYKTKTLGAIQTEAMGTVTLALGFDMSSTGIICRVAPGVDRDRTYRFNEVTSRSIFGGANTYWCEAIDDDTDTVTVDGCERFPHRVMWSNGTFVEEINPLNNQDVSRHDAYPITGMFRDDYTLGICTENDIWLLTGSFSVDPETFVPDFSIARSQSEHGSFCPRPDAMVQTPAGIIFIAKDGPRIFRGQNSERILREIKDELMRRIVPEPRSRESLCMHYESGVLFIAYPGMETA